MKDVKSRRAFLMQCAEKGMSYPEAMRALNGRQKKADGGEVDRLAQKRAAYASRGKDVPAELMKSTNRRLSADEQRNEEMIATELLGVNQAARAYDAWREVGDDNSLANITNAGVQSALAVGRPLKAAAVGGLGLLEAARRDFAPDILPSMSRAQSADPLSPDQRKRYQLLTRRSGGRGLNEAETNELGSYNEIIKAVGIANATAGTRAQSEKLANEENQRATDAKRRSDEDAAARARANQAYSSGLSTDRRFSDTDVGKMFDKFGPVAPGVVAGGTGLVTGAGLRGMGVGNKSALYGVPAALGGLAGLGAAHWPMAYEANYAPLVNPSYQAAENYIREAPEGDPRAAQLRTMLADGTIKRDNLTRTEAEKALYDPVKFGERSALGLFEGVVGGVAGSEALPAAKYVLKSLPKAAHEVGQIPGSLGRGVVDGFRSGSRGQVPPNSGNPPPPPPTPPVEYKRWSAVPQAERDKVLKAYAIARQLQGGGNLAPEVADQISQAYAKRNIKMPGMKKRLGDTNKVISDEVARTGVEPQVGDYQRLRTKDTFAVPLVAGAAAGASQMDGDREEKADGGKIKRALRAADHHSRNQNRYARGGSVHRKGMFKRGYKEDC